jgi:hypothetical protein
MDNVTLGAVRVNFATETLCQLAQTGERRNR